MYYYTAARDLPMEEEDFRLLRDLVRTQFGLYYDASKASLFKNRVLPRVAALGLTSFGEYYHYLKFHPAREAEMKKLVSHLTNNETYFFREPKQLDLFADRLLPAAVDARKSTLRILSAGCSTGEEPYTLAMLVQEKLGLLPRVKVDIVGVDVDEKVLEKARKGHYFKSSFRMTDPLIIHRYFQSEGEARTVRDSVRKPVHFFWANLVDLAGLRRLGKFDFIFCRNVLIYFEDDTIRRVIDNLSYLLNNDGRLLLGHSESLARITDSFEAERDGGSISYRKVLL
jgi:chemotaxis protein methyltransferase CheR